MKIALIDLWRVVRAKGGTEKVFCDMSNILLKNGHEVTAVCCENNFGPPGFPIDPGVRFLNAWSQETPWWLSEKLRNLWSLSLSRKRRHLLRVKFNYARYGAKIRKALSYWGLPDVFICSQIEAGVAVRCAFGGRVPIITMVHTNPLAQPLLQTFAKEAQSLAPIQVLMPEYVDMVHQLIPGLSSEAVLCLPNAVPQYSQVADRTSKKIMNVARLDVGKRQYLLVEAFALIKDRFPDWTLELWGEANVNQACTSQVESLIADNGLAGRVHLCGTTLNVAQELAKASVFAFPSDREGFPLALTEAMSMGLAVVGCRECSSVNSLIEDGKNGLLVESTAESLADALSKLMQNADLRISLGNSAKESMEQYSPQLIWGQWENLIAKTVVSRQLNYGCSLLPWGR